ncbi:hypothetical protein EVAR_103180_1 [Eumeta japonica]|uniref:Uncharacterized protein n=1 Tax=Eumeta variegata TaxID=151549 RepID=A0A4C1YCH6_EUMVA|nr:hypothetical protein EVAR_103180_1 [Eumeta japonica]
MDTNYKQIHKTKHFPIDQLVRVGNYELEKTIGTGNFAVVKLATHVITKTKDFVLLGRCIVIDVGKFAKSLFRLRFSPDVIVPEEHILLHRRHSSVKPRSATVFGDEASYKRSIYSWFTEFKRGRVNLSDDAVLPMIETDIHVTYHEIRAYSNIGMSQIRSILRKHLGAKNLCSRWISHNLTEVRKTDRVTWCLSFRFKEGASNLAWDIVAGGET